MATAALPLPTSPLRLVLPRIYVSVLLFGVALAIRLPHFGDPAFKIDEQFYLLVGDRLLHGALPYVDIWDRKPIGLFLIYAFARLLGGDGFWQYQLLATVFAAGTALCIHRIARRPAGEIGALIAAMLYLLWIEIAEGGGGQSPVFYNLLVAGAAALTLHATDQAGPAAHRKHAFAAMALIGLGIQIKYTVAVEGLFFGLVLAWGTLHRSSGRATAAREIALLALVASAPTLAAFGFYAAIGQAQAFWFANFSSIFLRAPTAEPELHYRMLMALARLIPFAFCALVGAIYLERDRWPEIRPWQLFMLGWCAASLFAFFSIGVLYSHYILPVFVPFTIAAAPVFRRWPIGTVLAAACAWLPASTLHWPDFDTTARSRRQIAALSALVPADVARGCLQMFDGPPILYYVTHACTVSRFVFPDHLSAAIEAQAIGIDPVAEVRRVLAVRPEAITISDVDVRPPNRTAFAVMRAGLALHYRHVGKAWVDERYISVFVRR